MTSEYDGLDDNDTFESTLDQIYRECGLELAECDALLWSRVVKVYE